MKVNVACVQMAPVCGDFRRNMAKMTEFIEQTMTEYPLTNLIVFPELITSGYECGSDFFNLAETVPDGTSLQLIGACARRHKVHIVYGFPEKDRVAATVLYNSAALIGPDGEVCGIYRKVHLFDQEKKLFTPGANYPVFSTPIGKIGLMICWDTAFPEVARSYGLQDVDLIAVTSNWEAPYEQDWDLVTRARAFDNILYVAAANRAGRDKNLTFFGRSKIIGPLGVPISELNQAVEGIIAAELDYAVPQKLRREYYTFYTDRRADTFALLTK